MKFLAVSNNDGDPSPFIREESAQMARLAAAGVV